MFNLLFHVDTNESIVVRLNLLVQFVCIQQIICNLNINVENFVIPKFYPNCLFGFIFTDKSVVTIYNNVIFKNLLAYHIITIRNSRSVNQVI